jgi:hypothetical protein
MKLKLYPTKGTTPLPNQLLIRDGKLICVDGTEPDFSDLPDGPITLMPRRQAETLHVDAFLARHMAS